MEDWSNQTVLIAAGSFEGVSRALTAHAIGKGACVIVLARSGREYQETYQEKDNVFVFPTSFQDLDAVPRLYALVKEVTGKTPTIFINDIRYQLSGLVENTPIWEYEWSFRSNALFVVELVQNLIPDMLANKNGVIVNILSAVIYHSFPGVSAYFSAKAGLGAIHESLRAELIGTPIRTLYVRPGGFLSNYWKKTDIGNRIEDFPYPSYSDIRDPEHFAKRLFRAIELGKVEVNTGSIKDRLGYHLNYWAPSVLERIISKYNQDIVGQKSADERVQRK